MRIFIIILLIIFTVFAVVMNLLSNYYQPSVTTTLSTSDIKFVLETEKKTFRQGEDVNIKLSLTNIKSEPLDLKFETTKQCEFIIRKEQNFILFSHGMDIWKSTYNKKYEDREVTITLKPNETKVYKTTWKQIDAGGTPVEPGKYSISATLCTINKQPLLQLKMNTN